VRSRWGGWPGSLALPGMVSAALVFLPNVVASATASAPDSTPATSGIPIKLPADHVYRHGVGRDSSVTFSHQTHVSLAGGQCTICHPQPYPMLRPAPVPHHGEMNAGGSCGMCHDGKNAFGVKDTAGCQACHSGIRTQAMAVSGTTAAPTARPIPKPHAYPKGADSPGRVTFRHQTHSQGTSTCTSCHPKPFRMAAVTPPPGGAMHEKDSCGGCHDGKKSFATDDPDACERCHRETGAGK